MMRMSFIPDRTETARVCEGARRLQAIRSKTETYAFNSGMKMVSWFSIFPNILAA